MTQPDRTIKTAPLTADAFAPYGDVLAATGAPDAIINQGKCGRFHDRAKLEFGGGRAAISVFKAELRPLPYTFDIIEKHPDGSQCFVPMTNDPFLVIVADHPGATPRAFITDGAQAINFHAGTWHGVLTPLTGSGLFTVIDRVGPGANLVEHHFEAPWTVTRG